MVLTSTHPFPVLLPQTNESVTNALKKLTAITVGADEFRGYQVYIKNAALITKSHTYIFLEFVMSEWVRYGLNTNPILPTCQGASHKFNFLVRCIDFRSESCPLLVAIKEHWMDQSCGSERTAARQKFPLQFAGDFLLKARCHWFPKDAQCVLGICGLLDLGVASHDFALSHQNAHLSCDLIEFHAVAEIAT